MIRRLVCLSALICLSAGLDTAFADSAGVDGTLQSENAAKGVKIAPAPRVDDLSFLRRVYVDLIGRIPTNGEIDQYLARPKNTRRAEVVDQLLKHPRFAGRWTVFFGDMLRLRANAEGGAALTAFVYRSIADGMPYDELVRRLIATNGKAGQTPEVGYVLGDNADPMALAGITSQVFMGVRIACAQCHDHPFDKWTRKDFYGFASYFGKTRRVQRRFGNRLLATYSTEVRQTSVLWPPEGAADSSTRKPMPPTFPVSLEKTDGPRRHLARLAKIRAARIDLAQSKAKKKDTTLDDLLGDASKKVEARTKGGDPTLRDLTESVRRDVKKIAVKGGGYKNSELRTELAGLVTDPRNRFFSRAIVNRLWKELVGRGFVEPIDDFSDRNQPSHPKTLDYLADEFVAGGFDLRKLVRMVVLSDVYQRSHVATSDEKLRVDMESAFLAVPMRRVISEALYDSLVTAGHLSTVKHAAGKNLKTVWRQSRIMKEPGKTKPGTLAAQSLAGAGKAKPAMKGPKAAPAKGYNVESAIEIDFDKILKRGGKPAVMVGAMRVKSKEELEAERMAQDMKKQRAEYFDRFVKDVVDDNPRFGSSLKMAAPAAPEHFLRVFGQPGRSELGDFRDENPSMRQALILLNGRLTNEAARVGELEPLYPLLTGKKADITKAIQLAYREILTRVPTREEIVDAKQVIAGAKTPLAGMSDLRWVLLNSNEFRFLP